ncbi:unnamed protein product [Rotaria sp. Silwood2]|nr:unnamed protein product [Rotaria sp. Silwood2]
MKGISSRSFAVDNITIVETFARDVLDESDEILHVKCQLIYTVGDEQQVDRAIVLTQLSYYYRGLNESQMWQCLNRLSQEEKDRALIYEKWILKEHEKDIDSSIQY